MQLIQQFQIRGIQLRPLGIADHIGVALLLDPDPERLRHLVEDTSNAPLHGGAPVSYTHLDVYKRQMFDVDEQARKINGVLESPSAEKMPVATL